MTWWLLWSVRGASHKIRPSLLGKKANKWVDIDETIVVGGGGSRRYSCILIMVFGGGGTGKGIGGLRRDLTARVNDDGTSAELETQNSN